jgi:RNA polymerase sigma-70 factor, ECF subfamily
VAQTRDLTSDDIATRQRRRRDTVSLTVVEDDPGEPDHAASAVLSALVQELDADRRGAFVLTQVLGCSHLEAAGLLGCPVGTIRSRVARARAELVSRLDETSDEYRRSG